MPAYRNDTWTLDHGLGIAAAGDEVARLALEAEPPFTIGVVGKWGAGKTSVLRRAFATLGGRPVSQALPFGDSNCEVDPAEWERWNFDHTHRPAHLGWSDELRAAARAGFAVWYSPWQHQGADNPLVPLLLEIRAQLDDWQRARGGIAPAARSAGMAALHLLERAVDGALTLQLGKPVRIAEGAAEGALRAWREGQSHPTAVSDGQRFHLLFERAAESLLLSLRDGGEEGRAVNEPPPGARLVIFVDDLDRCEEAVVVGLLEAIKLYLGTRRCLFVLGIDDGAVLSALRRHWPGRSEDDNREYLEKLFQAVVPLPLPAEERVDRYVAEQLAHHRFPDHASLEKEIRRLLEPNPRKIKNFVNGLCAAWSLWHGARHGGEHGGREHARRFLLFHYLRVYHRPVWRLLERQPLGVLVAMQRVFSPDAPSVAAHLPDGVELDFVEGESQRMMTAFLRDAFGHILPALPGVEVDRLETHHHLPLEKAVEVFLQRLDRKRSDEQFAELFRALVSGENLVVVAEWLRRDFLHLPVVG